MKIWLTALFSDAQGIADDARVAAFILVLAYIGNQAYALYRGQPWDAQAFGIGAGALVGGVGALFGLRKDH